MHKSDFYQIKDMSYTGQIFELETSTGQSLQIAKHIYASAESESKTLTLIHGYLENCRYMEPVIQHFVEKKFVVNCYELPGHGQSTGTSYNIDNFKTYELFHNLVLSQINPDVENIFFAHSTGAVGITASLLEHKAQPFSKIILAAPLTRVYLWKWVSTGGIFLSKFLNRMVRIKPNRGPLYHHIRNMDPFYKNSIPLNWTQEIIEYDMIMEKNQEISHTPLLVLYGAIDKVIDWHHSKNCYAKHFPNAQIEIIKKGTHHMYFNQGPVGIKFFNLVDNFLKEN